MQQAWCGCAKAALSAQACKALGLRQDDLVATSDIIAGKNTAGACSALWSVASVCVERCYKARSHLAFIMRIQTTF